MTFHLVGRSRPIGGAVLASVVIAIIAAVSPAAGSVSERTVLPRSSIAGAVALSPTSGSSGFGASTRVLAGSDHYVFYERQVSDYQSLQMYVATAAGEVTPLGRDPGTTQDWTMAGEMLTSVNYATNPSTVHWYDLANSSHGVSPLTGEYLGATPTGWATYSAPQLSEESTDGKITALGSPLGTDYILAGATDESGVLVLGEDGGAAYVPYADPAHPVSVSRLAGIDARFATCHLIAVAAFCADLANGELLSLTGGPARSIPFATNGHAWNINGTALSPTGEAAVGTGSQEPGRSTTPHLLFVDPTGGSQPAFPWAATVVSAFGQIVFTDRDGTGIDTVDGPGATPRQLVAATLHPTEARSAGASVGAALWEDDQSSTSLAALRLMSEPVSNVGGSIETGPAYQVAIAPDFSDVFQSGVNVAWEPPTSTTAPASHFVTPFLTRVHSGKLYEGLQALSGDRALFTSAHKILNLGSGHLSDLPRSALAVTLWGNYVLYSRADSSLWRINLVTGRKIEVLPAHSLKGRSGVTLFEFGNHVGWSGVVGNYYQPQSRAGFLNVRHPRHVRSISTGRIIVGMSGNGLLLANTPEEGLTIQDASYRLRGYGAGSKSELLLPELPDSDPHFYADVSVNASVLTWLQDGVAWAAPVPVHNVRPRDLGAPLRTKSFRPQVGRVWKLLVPFDAPLTSCSVTFRIGHLRLRTLGCDPTYTPYGDAVVTWDGRDSVGGASPKGAVRWTLHAAGVAGQVLRPGGKPGPIDGTVTIS
jgi:hypothetical protein